MEDFKENLRTTYNISRRFWFSSDSSPARLPYRWSQQPSNRPSNQSSNKSSNKSFNQSVNDALLRLESCAATAGNNSIFTWETAQHTTTNAKYAKHTATGKAATWGNPLLLPDFGDDQEY